MNLADFRPGQSMSRSDFANGIQESLINDHFGIHTPPAPTVVGPDQVVISKAEHERYQSLNTVFSVPEVSQAAQEIILRRNLGYPESPAPAVSPAPAAAPASATPTAYAGAVAQPNLQQAPLSNGTVQTPAAPTPTAGNPFAEWFGTPTDGTPAAPAAGTGAPVPAPTNVQPTPTPQPQIAPTNTQPALAAPVAPQVPVGNDDEQYRLAVAREVLTMGGNPQEVIPLLDQLTPRDVAAVLLQARQNMAPKGPTNLAEQPIPDRPISPGAGYGYPAINPNAFKV